MVPGFILFGFLIALPLWRLVAFDENAAAHADLERRGQLIGPHDILIAGHARSQGLVVITGNPGEFRRVEGLRAEDWLAAS